MDLNSAMEVVSSLWNDPTVNDSLGSVGKVVVASMASFVASYLASRVAAWSWRGLKAVSRGSCDLVKGIYAPSDLCLATLEALEDPDAVMEGREKLKFKTGSIAFANGNTKHSRNVVETAGEQVLPHLSNRDKRRVMAKACQVRFEILTREDSDKRGLLASMLRPDFTLETKEHLDFEAPCVTLPVLANHRNSRWAGKNK